MDHVEPMDIDSDYEDKENSILHSNVLPRTPCTEKGYEELDISELNMKLRYSVTPASSPMSKSLTANIKEYKNIEERNTSLVSDNSCLTSSLNSTLTNNDSCKKVCPLQNLPTVQLNDTNRNVLVCRSLDNDIENNLTITLCDNGDENFSIPSTSSSIPHTPEATTPTKDLQKDGGSPIMRGLRSVLSMFRPSQSPIPAHEQGNDGLDQSCTSNTHNALIQPINISTPMHKTNRSSPKRSSPLKDSLVFKEDLEKELQWKDDSTILFKEEKIPKHKLLLQETVASNLESKLCKSKTECNKTLEYMDISNNDSIFDSKTMTEVEIKALTNIEANLPESDNEFVDCETTYTKVEIESVNDTKERGLEVIENKEDDQPVNSKMPHSENNYSLNATVPIESLHTSHCRVQENHSVTNKAINENSAVTSTQHKGESSSLAEVMVSSEICNSDYKEIDLSLKLMTNENNKIDLINSRNSSVEVNDSVMNKEILKVNNDNLSQDHLLKNDNTFTFDDVQYKDLSLSEVADKSEGNEIIHTDVTLDNIDTVINSLLKNSSSMEVDTKLTSKEFERKSYDKMCSNASNIETNSSLTENNIGIHDNIVNHRIIDEIKVNQVLHNIKGESNSTFNKSVDIVLKESEELQDNLCKEGTQVGEQIINVIDKGEHNDIKENAALVKTKIDEDSLAVIHDYSIDDIREPHASDSTWNTIYNKVLKKPDHLIHDAEVLDSKLESNILKTMSLNEKDNLFFINEANLLSNDKNVTFNASESDQETKDSILYNENQYFRMSIDTEIPDLRITENIKIDKNNQESQLNVDDNKSIQDDLHFSLTKCLDNVSVTKRKLSILENENCPSHKDEKSDLKITDDYNNYINTNSTNVNKIVGLPEQIPLPSDSEGEEIEFQVKKDSENSISDTNSNPKTNENKSVIFNSTPIEADSIEEIDEIGKINNTDLLIVKNSDIELKDNLDKHSIFEKNNTLDGQNEVNINNCYVIQSDTEVKSSTQLGSSSKSCINEDKYQTTSNNEQHSIDVLENSKVNLNSNELRQDIPFENSSTSNLGSDMKQNSSKNASTEVLNPFETKSNLQISPPLTPLPNKKGYDINFDNIDDPFATKTKIRESPTPELSTNTSFSLSQDADTTHGKHGIKAKKNTPKNKGRRSGNFKNNKSNVDFTNNTDINDMKKYDFKTENLNKLTPITYDFENKESVAFSNYDIQNENLQERKNECIENKADTSLDSTKPFKDMTKSVFNCPEIKDVNFCCSSDKTLPQSDNISIQVLSVDSQENSKNSLQILKTDEMKCVESKEQADKKSTPNNSNETFLSQNTDSNITREVNTEDEDTATFIEMEELIANENLDRLSQEKHMMELQIPDSAIDSENIDNGELFIDAEAFEFLLNQNKSNIIAESGKESLFLKFDPLFAKRVSSDGIIAALKKAQNKQSTPKKLTKIQLDDAINRAGPSNIDTTFDDGSDDASIQAMSKPMMVVNPAVNPIISPRKVITPKINRQSLTFTSPAMTVIDRLLSLSGNNSDADHNTSLPSRQHTETDAALTQLREMLADKDIHVHNLRSESKELKDRLSNLETQVRTLESESADRLRKINDLSETLVEKTKINKSMAIVVEEYERTIASLITQMKQEKESNAEERIMLIKERDEQTAHLASMEVSFSDLHSKYEKSKQIIFSMKSNEETYRKSIKEFEESLAKMQSNYELLKQHATSKLNHANQELEKFNRAHEAEILKLNALIKRKELHITSLEETLAQKTKANEELTAICDELINKVG